MNRSRKNLQLHAESGARGAPHRRAMALGLLAAGSVAALPAAAAGGHHAVDDAALLAPGQCQVETWYDKESGGARSLLHAGPACRLGAIELGVNVDRTRSESTPTTVLGPQLKWAGALNERWSAGAVVSVAGQDGSPGWLGGALVIPVTWQASAEVLAHLNVGRDFRRGAPDTSRAGLALEWAPSASWSFVAERFRESSANFWRAGARWSLTPAVNIDLSRADGMRGGPPPWWTLGLTWVFDR